MVERASGFQVSPSCSTCQLCLSTSETTRRWRQGLWNIWALSHGLRSSRGQEIRRQIWKGMIRQRAQAFSSPKITVASHFQWWSVTYLLSAKKAQKAEIWHSLSLSGLRIGVLEVVDLLVIQDDVKNRGECVHMAGCLHTHIWLQNSRFSPCENVQQSRRSFLTFLEILLWGQLWPPNLMRWIQLPRRYTVS